MVKGSTVIDGFVVPASAHTLEGFRDWAATLGENAPRLHFYQGEVRIEMSPQDRRTHLAIVSDINRQLGNLAARLDLGRYFEQGGWITNPGADLSTEPDGQLVLWETFESGEAQLKAQPDGVTTLELVGRVDMTLEVVSKTSEKKDLDDLVEGYARAGIPEYWIVDARGEELVHRLFVRTPEGTYREQPADSEGWLDSPVWQGRVRLDMGRDRVGLPRVALEHRPTRSEE